jgi:hypothetical protein
MKSVVILLLICVIAVGCTKIDYVGEEYPPTTHVDLFFSMDDVQRDYAIMGHIVASAPDLVSAEKMQKDIMKKAMAKGADGVVILGLERYQSGESTSYSETTSTKEKKGKTKVKTTGSSSTNVEEKKEIKATLLKYQ